MTNQIKLGDWVVSKKDKNKPFRVDFDVEEGSYIAEECEAWKAQQGEWVVISFGNENAVITKFEESGNYVDVEPFLGELPTFLKKD